MLNPLYKKERRRTEHGQQNHNIDFIVKLPLISQLSSTPLSSAQLFSEMSEEIVLIFGFAQSENIWGYLASSGWG